MGYDGSLKFDTKVDDSGFKSGIGSLTGLATKGAAAIAGALAVAGVAAINTGIEFESAFAGVKKTVDATDAQLAQLSTGIREMASEMPQSAAAIAGISEAAGQLGIETENILDFTKTMAMLGDATNMTSEDAATSLARLANITQMPQTEFDRLGSVVVALGNNLATTESEIVNMGLRLAGAGSQVGMSEDQIMSLSGALSSVGIEAEAGGSAISKVMVDMQLATETGGESLKQFASVAGMSANEFKTAFKEDAADALISFIEGLQDTEASGQSAIAVLDEMGISEVRMRDALLRAAGAGDLFRESMELGAQAWDENIALTTEAEQRYETLESKLGIMRNTVSDLGIEIYDKFEGPLRSAVASATDSIQDFTKSVSSGALSSSLDNLAEGTGSLITNATKLATTALPIAINGLAFFADNIDKVVIAFGAYKMATTVFSLTTKLTAGWKAASAVVTAYATATTYSAAATSAHMAASTLLLSTMKTSEIIMAALSGKVGLYTAAATIARNATAGLNAAIAANPIGALVTILGVATVAIAGVVATSKKATSELDNVTKSINDQKESWEELQAESKEQAETDIAKIDYAAGLARELDNLTDANGKVAESDRARADSLYTLVNELMPGFVEKTGEGTDATYEFADSIDVLIEKQKALALVEAYKDDYTEAIKAQKDAEENLIDLYTEKYELQRKFREEASGAQVDTATIEQLQAEIDAVNNNITSQEGLQDSYRNTVSSYEEMLTAYNEGNYDAAIAAVEGYGLSIKDATEATIEELQTQYDETNRSLEAVSDLYRSGRISEAVYDAHMEANEKAMAALEVARSIELEGGVAQTEAYASGIRSGEPNVSTAAEGVTASAFERFNALHPLMAPLANTAINNFIAGMNEAKSGVASTSQNIATETSTGIASKAGEMSGVGANYTSGFISGLGSLIGQVAAKAREIGRAAIKAVSSVGDVHSPSRVMTMVGSFYGAGFVLGLERFKDKVRIAAEALGLAAISGGEHYKTEYRKSIEEIHQGGIDLVKSKAKSYKDVGELYIDYVKEGLEAKNDALVGAMEKVYDKQYEALKEANEKAENDLSKQHKAAEKKLKGEKLEALRETNDAELKQLKKGNQKLEKEFRESAKDQISAYKTTLKNSTSEAVGQLKSTLGELSDTFEQNKNDLLSSMDSMQAKLSDGDLFKINDKTGRMYLASMDERIYAVERYDAALADLKTRLAEGEFSEDILKEITDMSVEDATRYAELLLSEGDGSFNSYMEKYKTWKDLAQDKAQKYYQDDLDELETEYIDKIRPMFETVPPMLEEVGGNAIKGFIDGLNGQKENASTAMQDFINRMKEILYAGFEVASPSKWAKREIGANLAKGIGVGYNAEADQVFRKMQASVSAEQAKITAHVSASVSRPHSNNTVERVYKSTHTESTPEVNFNGSLAALGRLLEPVITKEQRRRGNSMIKGATT